MAPRVVALGGGHGLAASLSALRRLTDEVTAVVTVADDGGSSGRLRADYDILPPGDLRMALAALCGDDEWGRTWARVLQHRFAPGGDLGGHTTGNVLIATLWDQLGDHVAGLDLVGRLLGARGRVLPMSLTPLEIVAEVAGADGAPGDVLTTVRGQVRVAGTTGRVRRVDLVPHEPPACPEALEAIADADWVVLGPGSWYTSVIPHLLVPALREALATTSARVLVNLNLVAQRGETEGMSALEHVDVLGQHAPGLSIDAVLADPASLDDRGALERAVECLGGSLVTASVARADAPDQHDPDKLARAYADLMGPA